MSSNFTVWVIADSQGSAIGAYSKDWTDIPNAPDLDLIDYGAFGSPEDLPIDNASRLTSYVTHLHQGRSFDRNMGLYFNKARWYDPQLGRFISVDPIGFGSGETNHYRFAGNSPQNASDPSGNFLITASVIAGAAVLTLGGSYYAAYHANEADIASGGHGGGYLDLSVLTGYKSDLRWSFRSTDKGAVRSF